MDFINYGKSLTRFLQKKINVKKPTEGREDRDPIRVMFLRCTVVTDILVMDYCYFIYDAVSAKSWRMSDTTIGNNSANRCVRIFKFTFTIYFACIGLLCSSNFKLCASYALLC